MQTLFKNYLVSSYFHAYCFISFTSVELSLVISNGFLCQSLHLATLHHPFSMALWEDRLYWTDWTQSHVVSCVKRDGKHVMTELKETSKQKYFGLVLYHPAMMEKVSQFEELL